MGWIWATLCYYIRRAILILKKSGQKKVKIQLYADEMNHMPILKQNNYKFTKKKDKKDKNNVRKNVMYEVSDEVAQNYL